MSLERQFPRSLASRLSFAGVCALKMAFCCCTGAEQSCGVYLDLPALDCGGEIADVVGSESAALREPVLFVSVWNKHCRRPS